MITLPLRIRYGRPVPRQAEAWLIPGGDCRVWLAELLRWEMPLAGVKLYCVPRSPSDLEVQGVLAILPEGSRPCVSARCQPYARIGRKGKGFSAAVLCLPVEARFDPDVTDEEVLGFLGSEENVYLWHPSCGLVAFEPGDRRSVADLLQPPSEKKILWDMAKPGLGFNQHLTAIIPERTPTAENAIAGGQEDIGSRSSSLKELPRSPEEPPEGVLARMAAAIKNKLTDLVQKSQRAQESTGADSEKLSSDQAAAQSPGERLPSDNLSSLTSVEYAISNPPAEIETQPASGGKHSLDLGRLAAVSLGAMAGMTLAVGHGLADLMRQTAKLGHWLGEKMQSPGRVAGNPPPRPPHIDKNIWEKQHRESLRLLHMLETDPDQGLRYALPFSSGRHRGSASPGSHLVSHDTDFNLNRLRGGQPADLWDLPHHLRERMIAKYHEVANRELQLGRFRRAAYIYAELLNNLDLAASALKAGKHWRDAAALYRERLHRDDEAARCFEEGGLWMEAIALYEELKDYERAGDFYRRLEQEENALHAYRAAVNDFLAHEDYLAAARLLEIKIGVPDEALLQLEAGWTASTQRGGCLNEIFRLLAHLGRHEAAAAKIEQICRQSMLPNQARLLIDILCRLATTYPDATVGGLAADSTRTLVSTRLREASLDEKQRLLESLRQLVPGDRLLSRDCQRFLHPKLPPVVPSSKQAAAKPRSATANSSSLRLDPIKTIQLSQKVQWQTAVSMGKVFYAAGYEGKRLVLVQVCFDGTRPPLQIKHWEQMTPLPQPILLAPDIRSQQSLIVRVIGGPPLPQTFFPATDELPERVSVGTPSWIPSGAIAVECTVSGVTHLVEQRESGLILNLFDANGRPLSSRALPLSNLSPEGFDRRNVQIPLPLHARSDATYLAFGDRLAIVKPEKRLEIIELPDVILSLQGSWPFSLTRLVATMEEGALLYWDDTAGRRAIFATELERPVVRFTKGGWLVAASVSTCQVYRTEGHRIRLEGDCQSGKVTPLAVLDTADPNQFAVFGADGAMRLYQMPHG